MAAAYRAYLPAVRSIAVHGFRGFRGFSEPGDRDDAIQQVFVTAFGERARLSYNGVDSYATYLRGVARNVIRQMLEKDKRFRREPEVEEPEQVDPEESLISREQAELLARFRAGLGDAEEREVLRRYWVEGRAEEKVAAELGITRYKTRKIIARLHRAITRHLKKHGITGSS